MGQCPSTETGPGTLCPGEVAGQLVRLQERLSHLSRGCSAQSWAGSRHQAPAWSALSSPGHQPLQDPADTPVSAERSVGGPRGCLEARAEAGVGPRETQKQRGPWVGAGGRLSQALQPQLDRNGVGGAGEGEGRGDRAEGWPQGAPAGGSRVGQTNCTEHRKATTASWGPGAPPLTTPGLGLSPSRLILQSCLPHKATRQYEHPVVL